MRVKMRNALNTDAPINLRRLSPTMKVYAGIVSRYHGSAFYQKKLHKRLEEAALAQMRQDESLKETLLAYIYKELDKSSALKANGKTASSIIVSISADKKESLDRILEHKEFLQYNVRSIPENEDLRKAFKSMPYMIEISRKVV